MHWTDSLITDVVAMWNSGATAESITGQLRRKGHDVTRNSVIGTLRRARERNDSMVPERRPPKAKETRQSRRSSSLTRQRVVKRNEIPIPPDAPPSLGLDTMQLTSRSCRWPYGDGPFTFCGHDTGSPNTSYCPFHVRAASSPWHHRRLRMDAGTPSRNTRLMPLMED